MPVEHEQPSVKDDDSLEAQLLSLRRELAESNKQRDLAIRLLRRQMLANERLQRQLSLSARLALIYLSTPLLRAGRRYLGQRLPQPLKEFIRRNFLSARP
jgi:hypothetical protein